MAEDGKIRSTAWMWPVGVVCMLGVSLTVCGITVYAATTDESFAIEEGYYEKAVAWDDIAEQRAHNEELGWRVQAALEINDGDAGRLSLGLTDADGQPIRGATVRVEAFHHAARRNSETYFLTESEIENGWYSVTMGEIREGRWQVRLRVTTQSEVFTETIDLYAQKAGG